MQRILLVLFTLFFSLSVSAQQVLRFATLAPDGSPWMREMRAAAAEVEKQTNGRVKVRFFPGGVMGNDVVVLRKIRLGQLHGAVLTSSELSTVNPDAPIYSLPFTFSNWDQVDRARKEVDPLLASGFEQNGMYMLGASGVGFAYLMSTRPIKTREDLRSGKLWTPNNDMIAERTFTKGGVTPIPLPIGDVFTSLQTGMIDTVANTPSGAVALQWHGKIRHIMDLPLSYVVAYVVVDLRAWQRIPAADRTIVGKIFKSASARVDSGIRKDDEDAMAAMVKQGLLLTKPSAEEEKYFREVGQAVIADIESENAISPKVLAALRRVLTTSPSATAAQ